jgi:hypothetical protein
MLLLVCHPDNDLFRVLRENAIPCSRYDDAALAVAEAPAGAGVLVLADGYPDVLTAVDPALFQRAKERGVRLYVEFPAMLPGLEVGEPQGTRWERAVVFSAAFAPALEPMRILMIHGCRFVPVQAEEAHIAIDRVAGFDSAVYGLPADASPILFEHDGVLAATTKLSQFVTARYAPAEAWQAIWRWILRWCGAGDVQLQWTPSVRPTLAADAALPADVEAAAMRRGAAWFNNAKLFIDPSWDAEADRRLREYEDGIAPAPEADWLLGDGSCGMIEGANSTVLADGAQEFRYYRRHDCIGEAAMAMAFNAKCNGTARDAATAANLGDYIYTYSTLAKGAREDPASPSYGLVAWFVNEDLKIGAYYGDDNARGLLGVIAASALLENDRWDKPLLRCLLVGPQRVPLRVGDQIAQRRLALVAPPERQLDPGDDLPA